MGNGGRSTDRILSTDPNPVPRTGILLSIPQFRSVPVAGQGRLAAVLGTVAAPIFPGLFRKCVSVAFERPRRVRMIGMLTPLDAVIETFIVLFPAYRGQLQ